jgi:glyoxylase-like metal-dependent hydrolase (beta-lactamase superfamily II)
VSELADLEVVAFGDVHLRAVHAPGPAPEHLAFAVGSDLVIAGDLDGSVGARTIALPPDPAAVARSRARLAELRPGATWLSAHPAAEATLT